MRWTLMLDFVALAGLSLTTLGFAEIGRVVGLGPALALLWLGGCLITAALFVAGNVRRK